MRSFLLAVFGLALVAASGASAAPVAPIGKGSSAIDLRTTVHYTGYYHRHHRHYRHHRHCWWRHGYRVCRWW